MAATSGQGHSGANEATKNAFRAFASAVTRSATQSAPAPSTSGRPATSASNTNKNRRSR
jgi:hypothetical protein